MDYLGQKDDDGEDPLVTFVGDCVSAYYQAPEDEEFYAARMYTAFPFGFRFECLRVQCPVRQKQACVQDAQVGGGVM